MKNRGWDWQENWCSSNAVSAVVTKKLSQKAKLPIYWSIYVPTLPHLTQKRFAGFLKPGPKAKDCALKQERFSHLHLLHNQKKKGVRGFSRPLCSLWCLLILGLTSGCYRKSVKRVLNGLLFMFDGFVCSLATKKKSSFERLIHPHE